MAEETNGKEENASRRPWSFPRHTLEDALAICTAIEEKNGGNPWPADQLTKAVNFNQANDWRFKALLRSSFQYGLTEGTGPTATVSITDLGQDVVVPSSPQDRARALRAAFAKVEDFKKVDEYYSAKSIPDREFFVNTLIREFDIQKDRVDTFIEIFTANRKFLASFSPTNTEHNAESDRARATAIEERKPLERPRSHIDKCFVMMPFGPWFNKYYSDIYVPAINAAGFEPVRADELFHTGSVVEQIWEQIRKSKVLLADLTGRNPNVFYELGLAHAAQKPVVFTAGAIDDVPFDLRHLRVIPYEIREPDWAETLRKNVTEYLSNAKREPAKSIPSTFRPVDESKLDVDDSD